MVAYQLAQLNIAKALYGMEAPEMSGFNNRLDSVNAIADSSPGFVWRLQSEQGNATDYQIFNDPMYLVNISVWESFEDFSNFIRSPLHLEVMSKRSKWFEKPDQAYICLWWVPGGHRPDVSEAQQRLELLRANGPSQYAFGFASHFPPPA